MANEVQLVQETLQSIQKQGGRTMILVTHVSRFDFLPRKEKKKNADKLRSLLATEYCQNRRRDHYHGCGSYRGAGHAQRADGPERPLLQAISICSWRGSLRMEVYVMIDNALR